MFRLQVRKRPKRQKEQAASSRSRRRVHKKKIASERKRRRVPTTSTHQNSGLSGKPRSSRIETQKAAKKRENAEVTFGEADNWGVLEDWAASREEDWAASRGEDWTHSVRGEANRGGERSLITWEGKNERTQEESDKKESSKAVREQNVDNWRERAAATAAAAPAPGGGQKEKNSSEGEKKQGKKLEKQSGDARKQSPEADSRAAGNEIERFVVHSKSNTGSGNRIKASGDMRSGGAAAAAGGIRILKRATSKKSSRA